MKLFFLILFIPIVAFAGESSFQEALLAQINVQIKKECETCTAQIQIHKTIANEADLVVKKVSSTHWKGETVLRVDVESKDVASIDIPVRVHWMDDVVIAKNNIRHGSIIKERQLKVINKDVTFIKNAYLSDVANAVGKVSRRSFRKGQVIDENTIKAPRIVKYGQPIKVIFENGVLSMTVSGKAKGSGAVGDTIPIVLSKTKKKVMAKIIDRSSARME